MDSTQGKAESPIFVFLTLSVITFTRVAGFGCAAWAIGSSRGICVDSRLRVANNRPQLWKPNDIGSRLRLTIIRTTSGRTSTRDNVVWISLSPSWCLTPRFWRRRPRGFNLGDVGSTCTGSDDRTIRSLNPPSWKICLSWTRPNCLTQAQSFLILLWSRLSKSPSS